MADTRISELTAATATNLGANTLIPVVLDSGTRNRKVQVSEAGKVLARYAETFNASGLTMATEDESDTPQPYFRLLPGGGAIANHVVKDGGTGDVISSEMLFTTFYNATTPAATLWRSMGSGAAVVAAFDPYTIPGDAGSPARNFADGELVRQLLGADERLFAADGALSAIDFGPSFLVPAPTGTGSDAGIWVEVSPDAGTTTAPLIDITNTDLYDALDEIGGSGSLRPGLYRVTDATGGPVYLIAVGPHRLWPEFAAQDVSGSGSLVPGVYDVAGNAFDQNDLTALLSPFYRLKVAGGRAGYATLSAAIAAAVSGDVVVVNGAGLSLGVNTTAASGVALDCNGYSITIGSGITLTGLTRIIGANMVGDGTLALTRSCDIIGGIIDPDINISTGVEILFDGVNLQEAAISAASGATIVIRGTTSGLASAAITALQGAGVTVNDYRPNVSLDGSDIVMSQGGEETSRVTIPGGSGDVAGDTHAATGKTTPVDADELPLVDSAASWALKKLTWANLKAGLFSAWGALVAAATGKTTPVDADTLVLSDSAASDATKKLTWANLKATLKTYFDTLYSGRKIWNSSTTVTCDTTIPFNTISQVEADFTTITANDLVAGDWIDGIVMATRPGSQSGNITVRVYLGTNATATSNQLIATYTASSSVTDLCMEIKALLATTASIYYNGNTTTNSSTVTGSSAGSGSTNVDTTAAMRLSITIQKVNASDTIVFRGRLFRRV